MQSFPRLLAYRQLRTTALPYPRPRLQYLYRHSAVVLVPTVVFARRQGTYMCSPVPKAIEQRCFTAYERLTGA